MVENVSGLIPTGFAVLVELDPVATKTAGGLYLPDTTVDKDKVSAVEGTLVAVSPAAFDYAHWPEGSRKPAPGDRVLFKRYTGWEHERGGKTYKLLNDQDIVAIVEPFSTSDGSTIAAGMREAEKRLPRFPVPNGDANPVGNTNGLRETAMDRVGEV